MKGQIFNLFENFVGEVVGADVYEQALELAKPELETKQAFVGPGVYPDNDFFNLVKHTLKLTKLPAETAVSAFGEYCFPKLLKKLPSEMQEINSAKEFLLKLNDTVHVEVKKVNPGAIPPKFGVEVLDDCQLLLRYESKRKLFAFVEGMLRGLAKHYQVSIKIERKIIQMDPIGVCEYLVILK